MTPGSQISFLFIILSLLACQPSPSPSEVSAREILGNPNYPAICYSGYRARSRDEVPSKDQIKEDMQLLSALGFRIIRTYNTQLYGQTPLILEAIRELKEGDPTFEMYVMLGAWIQCKGAFGDRPDHTLADSLSNAAEVTTAIAMAQQYPDIIKIIAVGNEAMVHWAGSYFVQAEVILHWVNHLQQLKAHGKLPADLWITSSDNFASWGGGSPDYHKPALKDLIEAVDYVSLHSYPFHDSHYNPDFWRMPADEDSLTQLEQIDSAMARALEHLKSQYHSTRRYIESLEVNKPIHIGETGWASSDNSFYGAEGSRVADEYKQKLYYEKLGHWSEKEGVSCFYFEAFDEPWKDASNPGGSENHFGLFTVDGQAKYALWEALEQGKFEGLSRDGHKISKSQRGAIQPLKAGSLPPPSAETTVSP